jgi:hypothetical protein
VETRSIDFATEFAIGIKEDGVLGFCENFEVGFDKLSVRHSAYLSFVVSTLYHILFRLSTPNFRPGAKCMVAHALAQKQEKELQKRKRIKIGVLRLL